MSSAESPVTESALWVVDASLAFGWFVEMPASAQAVRLLDAAPPARLLAPDLALAESRNARLITQDQRLLRRLGQDPQTAGLAVALEAW